MVPEQINKRIIRYIYDKQMANLKNKILRYYKNDTLINLSGEEKEVISYLEKNPISIFPYDFWKSYYSIKVKVIRDDNIDLSFVLLDNKRLYFPRVWNENQIMDYFRWIQIEQDLNSPHRYLTQNFFVSSGDLVIDVGAGEGNFALSVVEEVKKMYLFEVEEDWIEALNATFKPWCDKVKIINKFVSDKDDDKNVTLDSMFKDERIDFIKIDVDGAEMELLSGCKNLFSNPNPIKIALCTYHHQNDANDFKQILLPMGFEIEYSKGYMIFLNDKLKPPYLRRGLIRAKKRVV